MTADNELLGRLEGLARRAAEAEGVDVAWCELKGREGTRIFRVFIEKTDGDDASGHMTLDDCERVTKRLGVVLDVEDPIESAYTLEVSTPGLDRPLHNENDYRRFAGKFVRVKTKELLDGRKRFIGRISGIGDGTLILDEETGTTHIPMSMLDSGRLELELNLDLKATSRKRA